MSLHPQQKQALELLPELLPDDSGVVLLTRHSIREQASNDMPGFDIPLTPEGVELARNWGAALPYKIRDVYSSQSPRCIHTGQAMLEGAESGEEIRTEVIVHDLLCEPGCYVEEMRVAGRTFASKGPLEFVSRTLQGRVEGNFAPREGTRRLLDFLKSLKPGAGELSLCITHDTILGSFVYELAEKKHLKQDDWPWMMEGVFIWFTEDHIHWIWRGKGQQKSQLVYQL